MTFVALLLSSAAVIAPAPPPAGGDAASPPAGPPLTTPLVTQGRDAPLGPQRPTGVAPGGGSPLQAAPLAAGQTSPAAAGVTSYPASFFASALPNTAYDMINRTPGFSLSTGGGSRGFSDAGNALIDGARPSSKDDDLQSILTRLPASQVERIDVIRGGAPGIDMQGLAVVANVVRKKGSSTTGVISVTDSWITSDGRQEPTIRIEGSRRADGRTLEASFTAGSFPDDGAGRGPRVRRDGAGDVIDSAYDRQKASNISDALAGSYETPLAGGKLRVNEQVGGSKYFFNDILDPTVGAPAGSSQSRERDHQNQEGLEVGGDYTRDLTRKLKSETVVLQSVKGEDFLTLFDAPDDAERFREQHTQIETVGREVLTWTAARRLTVEGGAEFAYNNLASHTSYIVNSAAQAIPGANVDVREFRGEAFAKATWTATRTLTAELGFRLEVSDIGSTGDVVLDKTLVYPKPRLQLTWSPTPADQIRLRAELEVSQLNFNDFVAGSSFSTGQVLAGNPNLVPQQAKVLELAYERRFWGSGDITVTLRHAQLTDVIDRAPIFSADGPFDAPANIGSGRKDELGVDLTLPLDRVGIKNGLIKGNFTVRNSAVTDPTTHTDRGISGLHPYDGGFDFTQDVTHLRMQYGVDVFPGYRQRYFRFNQVETDTFDPLISLFVDFKPKPDLDLKFSVNHLNDRSGRQLTVTDGVRGVDPIAYAENRPLTLGPYVYARVRKTF